MYQTYKPKSEQLRKYIQEFTVLDDDGMFPKEYFAFPHHVGAIVFMENAEFQFEAGILKLDKNPTQESLVITIGKYLAPLFVRYEHFVNEIAINFTPTGMNYFMDEHFSDIANLPIQELKNIEFSQFSKKIFTFEKADRIEQLELFLMQQLREKNMLILEQVVELLEADKSLKFKDICNDLTISERTVNRLFHKYMGCSPKDYKKIIRFRGAIKDYQKNEFNLTEIGLQNDYYDSPHFSREFKKLTNQNPKDYFKQLTYTSNKEYPYIFK